MKPNKNCSLCKLHKTTSNVCVLGSGPKRSEVVVITEAPSKAQKEETGGPLDGRAGRLLKDLLDAHDILNRNVYWMSAVSCRPPGGKGPTKGEIKACKEWVDRQLAVVQPKYVLLIGNAALQSITGAPGIRAKRGKPFEKDGVIYLPTYNPSVILHDERQRTIIDADIRLFKEVIERGGIPREDALNLTIVKNRKQFEQMLDALVGCVSFDIETNGLYPWATGAKVVSIGFGTKGAEWNLPIHHAESPWHPDAIDDMIEEITERLDDCQIVAHNGKFDFLWMLVHFGVKWYEHFVFDTMLAHYLIDENDRHGLKYLAQKYCGAPNWDADLDTKKGASNLASHAMYHAHDLHYTRRLRFILGRLLSEDEGVARVFKKVLMPCARMFVEVEYDGVYVDQSLFGKAEDHLRNQYDQALKELAKFGNINWGSPQQVAKLLFEDLGLKVIETTKGGKPSTSESVIKRLDHPCTAAMLRFREAKQQLSFFIDGWKPFLHKGYLHPSFKLHGTVTGRLSCENPNLQQVPRDPRIRTLITAPPGWTLIECDLSQIELRIAAELANERKMIHAFNNNIDVHWLTAISEISRGGGLKDLVIDTASTWRQKKRTYSEAIDDLLEMGPDVAAEINKEWKEYRKKAKAINFGYLYGMWWRKFKDYARDNYGVLVTDEQAQASREAFFDNYSDLPAWHGRQRRFVRRNGYVRSLSGRMRRLPRAMDPQDTPERREAERQAINSPVQSFANEINLMSALQLRDEFGRDKVRICGTVHDAILLRAKDKYVAQVMTRLLEIMTKPALFEDFDIDLSVPVLGEGKVGAWGAGVDLHKWLKANGSKDH